MAKSFVAPKTLILAVVAIVASPHLIGLAFAGFAFLNHKRLYNKGSKVIATITKIVMVPRGKNRVSISFPYKIKGKDLLCRTDVDMILYSNAVGWKVRVVPRPGSCFDVLGPYDPPFR